MLDPLPHIGLADAKGLRRVPNEIADEQTVMLVRETRARVNVANDVPIGVFEHDHERILNFHEYASLECVDASPS